MTKTKRNLCASGHSCYLLYKQWPECSRGWVCCLRLASRSSLIRLAHWTLHICFHQCKIQWLWPQLWGRDCIKNGHHILTIFPLFTLIQYQMHGCHNHKLQRVSFQERPGWMSLKFRSNKLFWGLVKRFIACLLCGIWLPSCVCGLTTEQDAVSVCRFGADRPFVVCLWPYELSSCSCFRTAGRSSFCSGDKSFTSRP